MVPQRTVSFKCRPMHMHPRAYGAYRKIPKISPGAYFFPRRFLRGLYGGKFAFQSRLGLYWEGNLRPKIDWASL